MVGALLVWAVLALVGTSSAYSQQDDGRSSSNNLDKGDLPLSVDQVLLEDDVDALDVPEEDVVAAGPGMEEDGDDAVAVQVNKRDLEFNQYVPGYRIRGEPSCEELRAMWRLSKREARRATSTNQLPRTRSYAYGRLIPFGTEPRQPKKPVIGHVTLNPDQSSKGVPSKGALEKLMQLLREGGQAPRPGSFQLLKEAVIASKDPNMPLKGQFEALKTKYFRERNLETAREVEKALLQKEREQASRKMAGRPVASALRSLDGPALSSFVMPRLDPDVMQMDQPLSRGGSFQRYASAFAPEGFSGPLLPAEPPRHYIQRYPQGPNPYYPGRDPKPMAISCSQVRRMRCVQDEDCACAGLYRCSKGRCKASSKQGTQDSRGTWYNRPFNSDKLGIRIRGPVRAP